MQTNNIVFDKKSRYMIVLKDLTVLKTQLEQEGLKNPSLMPQVREINDIYNRTIVGLIREKIPFQFVQDATDATRDLIRISLDGVNYDCGNVAIYNILKDDYEKIMHFQYEGPIVTDVDEYFPRRSISSSHQESVAPSNSAFNTNPQQQNVNNMSQDDLASVIKQAIKEERAKDPSTYTPRPQYSAPIVGRYQKQSAVKRAFNKMLTVGLLIIFIFLMALLYKQPVVQDYISKFTTQVTNQLSGTAADDEDLKHFDEDFEENFREE